MLPFRPRHLAKTELTLAFFMASLLLKPTINVGKTIRGYETHVKYWFRTEGCPKDAYATPFLSQIRTGISKTLPSCPDERAALLLPNLIDSNQFLRPRGRDDMLFRFATVIGFIGMLRPHTFDQLGPSSFVFVLNNGRCVRWDGSGPTFKNHVNNLCKTFQILGFYITFRSKTMTFARAYYPSLCSREKLSRFSAMCPVKALIQVASYDMVKTAFMKKINRGKRFAQYFQYISSSPADSFVPYALRIGGRTWLLSRGMDKQLCDLTKKWS